MDPRKALRDVLGAGADINAGNPLQVFDPKVWGALSGLILYGVVTAVPGANQFTIPTLAGLGAGKFSDMTAPFSVFVFRDAGGTNALPQGQMRTVTGYTTATGIFATDEFDVAVGIGDEILILHPRIAEMLAVRDIAGRLEVPLTAPFVKRDTQFWTGAAGQNQVWGIATDERFIYVAIFIAPATVIKIDPITMKTVRTWVHTSADQTYAVACDTKGHLFVGLKKAASATSDVIMVDTATMTTVPGKTWDAPVGANDISRIICDGRYIYAACYNTIALPPGNQGRVYRIDPTTTPMTTVATWIGAAGQHLIAEMVSDGTNLYITTGDVPSQIVQISKATMLTVANYVYGIPSFSGLAFDGHFLWGLTTDRVIRKLDPAGLVFLTQIILPITLVTTYAVGFDFDGQFLYVGTHDSPGDIMQVDPNTLSVIDEYTLPAGQNGVNYLRCVNGLLYVGLDTSPAMVAQRSFRNPTWNFKQLASGTLTASDTTVPADTTRLEATGYWDGCRLMTMEGAVARQPKLIVHFNNVGAVFTLDPEHPFTAAPGLVPYIILPPTDDVLLPAAGTASDFTSAHVIGRKDDPQVTVVGVAASIVAYIKGLLNRQARVLVQADYWSIPQLSAVVPAIAANQALPNVVVADLPAGITVVKATAIIMFRSISNAGAANKLSGAQHIQIQKGGGGGFNDAISLVDDMFTIAAATVDAPGTAVIGDHNVVAKVDGNATYNFQWTAALADVAGLTFNDVQVGLRIWYSLG